MKKTAQWLVTFALASSGGLVFACGGGNAETGPTNAGSSSAATPPPSTTPSTSTATTTTTTTASAAVSTAAPIPPAPPLTIVAMKMTMTDAAKKAHTLELKADGTLTADGKPAGKVTNAEIDDASGQMMVAVQGDNSITIAGQTSSSKAKFNDKDAIEVDGNTILSVADDGAVTLIGSDGKPDTKAKVKFTGFKPTARRTAALLVLGTFMLHQTKTTAISSASAATSAAPPPKK